MDITTSSIANASPPRRRSRWVRLGRAGLLFFLLKGLLWLVVPAFLWLAS